MNKSLDVIVNNKNLYFLSENDNSDIKWVFYAIIQPKDPFEYLLSIYFSQGLYIQTAEGKKYILVNLIAPLNLKLNTYDIRKLVRIIIHETLHAYGILDEKTVRRLTKELIKGQKYSKIRIKG